MSDDDEDQGDGEETLIYVALLPLPQIRHEPDGESQRQNYKV